MAERAWAITTPRQFVFLWTVNRTRSGAIRALFEGTEETFETDADLSKAWRREKRKWPGRRARRVRVEVEED